jgi:DNA-3-methyladenine glycosylase II
MFLIFSLGRMDIFSLGDLGLKRSIQWLYRLKKTPTEGTLLTYSKKWAPFRSVASLYLWEIINRGIIKQNPDEIFSKTDRIIPG